MDITLGSIFRNSASYLPRYFNQVASLSLEVEAMGHRFYMLGVEGDSTDDTWQRLHEMARGYKYDMLQVNHGGPAYGSVENPNRWRNISKVCNALLDMLQETDDIFIYVESDLIWQADMMLNLVNQLEQVDVVCPMCFRNGEFYDTWGYRKNGQRFSHLPPYHSGLNGQLTQIDSAGSCLVMRGEVARNTRFDPADQGIVGWCENIRSKGYEIWIDQKLAVNHP